LEDQGEFRISI